MKRYNELEEKINCIVNKMNELAKKPREFGIGQKLYQSEIHTISAISNHTGINANELSKVLGVTNGAVTQITNKLIQKGLVEKYKKNNNNKEVYIRLTDLGEIANQGHDAFHEEMRKNLKEYLNELQENQIEAIVKLFDTVIENLPRE